MESLQTLNPNKDEASDAQIMFWSCTPGLNLIPLAIMAQRAVLGAADPSGYFYSLHHLDLCRNDGRLSRRCDSPRHQFV